MDDQPKTKLKQSLRRELTQWTIIITLIVSSVVGLLAGTMSYFEAREVQDDMLKNLANLVANSEIPITQKLGYDYDDSMFIVQIISKELTQHAGISPNLPNGFDTVRLFGDHWRIYVRSNQAGQRFLVAQETELRNEIALANAFSALLSSAFLAFFIMALVIFMITLRLKPIANLANLLDKQTADKLTALPTNNIPSEISPFIEAINRLLYRTQQSIEQQQRFIADASHELRTPLAGLSLLVDNMEQENTPESKNQQMSLVRQGINRMQRLVDQLLDLARFQNQSSRATSQVKFISVLTQVVEQLYPLINEKNIHLTLLRTTDAVVENINHSLEQLVENALVNAIRYIPEGGVIEITLEKKQKHLVMTIADNGPGISQHELKKVFSPFYRIEQTGEKGSGLGLTLCQEIANAHAGTITLENHPMGGLIFRYTQPIIDS